MKFRTLIFSLIALSFLATLFADPAIPPANPPQKISGANQYDAVTLDVIDGTGLVKLNGTTVSNIHLTGSLITQNAHIGTLNIIGEANLKNTVVEQGGSVLGSLQATHSTFRNAITILSQKAVFTGSRLEGITVQKDSGFKGKQVLELRQGTLINGPIHFESGKGEVLIFPGCQVLGPVTGGKVVKK